MNKNIAVLTLFFILSIGIIFSCKKKKGISPANNNTSSNINNLTSFDSLKLSNVHLYYSSNLNNVRISLNYSIVYNSDNTVSSFNMVDELGTYSGWEKRTFDYFNGYYNINELDSPGVFCQNTVQINTKGMVLQFASNCYDSLIATYNYNGTEISKYNNIFYVWTNNDITYSVLPIVNYSYHYPYYPIDTTYDTTYYVYDKTMKGQIGDALQINDFLKLGRSLKRTYDLQKEQGINYSFDNQGRITKLVILHNSSSSEYDTTIYDYKYY